MPEKMIKKTLEQQIITSNDEHNLDYKMMQLAIEQAKLAMHFDEVPVGAVLTDKNNEIIGLGNNNPILSNDPTAHAEINAIRQAGQQVSNYRLPNTTLYVTLEPCLMCAGALIHARVSRVVFAAKDPRTGACGSVLDVCQHESLNHKIETTFIENLEYIELLKKFFRSRR